MNIWVNTFSKTRSDNSVTIKDLSPFNEWNSKTIIFLLIVYYKMIPFNKTSLGYLNIGRIFYNFIFKDYMGETF